MGLAQGFKFEYSERLKVDTFLKKFVSNFVHHQEDSGLWVISTYNEKNMEFELTFEKYGVYCHRSGDYFEVLGLFIEALTGEFGVVEINDL